MSKSIGILSKARKYLNLSCLTTLYYSYVYPLITYCIEVWGSCADQRVQSVFKLQKKAVRIINSSTYNEHTEPIFKILNILQLSKVYIFRITLFMFKCFHKLVPDVVNDMFVRNEDIHDYNTRSKFKYHIPSANLTCLRQSVRIKGIYWWNYYFDKLDRNCSFNAYKNSLRKYLTVE